MHEGHGLNRVRADGERGAEHEMQEADVVVYTATAAGVAASIAAARMGARVVLLEPGRSTSISRMKSENIRGGRTGSTWRGISRSRLILGRSRTAR